jgi:uncharacterized membrane protein YraQ (UPF0718 family)/regulator of protease activity HflC (stomatin/prohibitin superfamily)
VTQFFASWMQATWMILVESGPYLLAGFFIAGLLKVLIPERWIYRYLGQDNMRSVFLASLFGVPIPLCSCSVIPTAISLRSSGASKGATTSFLISTPETGVDSIGVTYALMDPIMTIVRPLSALLTAFFSGTMVNGIVKRGWDDQAEPEVEKSSCCAQKESEHEHDGQTGTDSNWPKPVQVVQKAARYAFGPLMADLTPWFIIGILLSGLIALVVPDNFFGDTLPNGWLSMVAMLFIGTPLYICATASTPVAAVLIAKGLDPGAALVLLLAGPATNLATIAVVRGFLGRRVLMAYLGSIAACSLAFGVGLNFLYDWLKTSPVTNVTMAEGEHMSSFAQLTGLVLLILLAYHAHKLGLLASWGGKLQNFLARFGLKFGGRSARLLLLITALAAYASTSWTALRPGQTGFLLSFGKLERTITEPGIIWHAPFPFAQVEAVDQQQLRATRVGAGFDDATLSIDAMWSKRELEAASEVLTRDGYLLKCAYSVHYRVADAEEYYFQVDDPAALVLAQAEASLRAAFIHRPSDELLISKRTEVQDEVRDHMQAALTELRCGVALSAVLLGEVHASSDPGVHYAFRDVASSLEDKQRYVRQAEEYRVRRQAAARANAAVLEESAQAQAHAALQLAEGDAQAFLALRAALAQNPEANHLRLQLETLEKLLGGKRLVLVLDPGRVVVPIPADGGQTAPLFSGRAAGSQREGDR